MILLQKAIENKKLDWKSNPADEIKSAIQEAQLTVGELTENQFLSNLMKDILRNNMPRAYYVKLAEIAEMLQKIPEIWKECGSLGSLGTTFQYTKHRYMRDKNDKYQGYHAHVTKKKVRHRERLCYCCRQTGHQAKDCSRNKSMNTSKRGMTGINKCAV